MEYQLVAPATCAAVFVYVFLRRRRRFAAVKDVPGPANPSWMFGTFLEEQPASPSHPIPNVYGTKRENPSGHQWYIQIEEAGGAARRFLEDFGSVVRWNGPFGVRLVFYRTNTGDPHSDFLLK